MKLIYNIGIYFYKIAIFIASFFNKKAFLLHKGQQDAFNLLCSKIDRNANYVWFHAASLGEFEQGRPVIEKLKLELPEVKIVLTFFSPSGYEVRKNYAGADVISYLPLDTYFNAKRFVTLVNPSKAIFIKYEFWPNYLTVLKDHNIPVYSISAIFRPTQIFFKSYGNWYRNLLSSFSHIFVQDKASNELLSNFQIDNSSIAGDTRFDRVVDLAQNASPIPLIELFLKGAQKVIVAGSSWPKDEELLVRFQKENPNFKLILVPHEIHEAHLSSIEKMLDVRSIRFTRADISTIHNNDCLIVDTIGLLSSIYRYADVAYIGGGFGVGIHNTLEAAVWKVPVVFGPNFQKFREARELIEANGAKSISNFDELKSVFESYSQNKEAGNNAGEYVLKNIGATTLILKALVPGKTIKY